MAVASFEIKKEQYADSVCRLCFTESDNHQLIFVDAYSSLPEWIEKLTTLKVTKFPNAPASLCLECENTLKNFESFREMCFTNDRVIKEMFVENDSKHDYAAVSEPMNEIETEKCTNQDTDIIHFKIESSVDNDIKIEADKSEDQQIAIYSTVDSEDDHIIEYQDIKFEVDSSVESEDDDNIKKDTKEVREFEKSNSFMRTKTQERKRHVCSLCQKEFMNSNRLAIHMQSHTQERPFNCNICGKSFITISNRNRHIIAHSGLKPYACDLCPAKYTQASHLKRHKFSHSKTSSISITNRMDENESPHDMKKSVKNNVRIQKLCTVCNKYVFKLKDHLAKHNDIRTYQCQYCFKSFNKMHKLTVHTRLHTNDKPFICNYCGKGFTKACVLKIHIKIHTQEKPLKCEECQKSFRTISHLARHKMVHSGIKPYSCDICQTKFSQSGHLQRHKQNIHKTDHFND